MDDVLKRLASNPDTPGTWAMRINGLREGIAAHTFLLALHLVRYENFGDDVGKVRFGPKGRFDLYHLLVYNKCDPRDAYIITDVVIPEGAPVDVESRARNPLAA